MGIQSSLYSVLTGDATITGLVGTKVRPEVGYPEEDGQQITYTTTDEPIHHAAGVAAIRRGNITLICWGTTQPEADALFDAVKAEMEGTTAPKTFGDVHLQTLRRLRADSSSTPLTETSENTPDWWVREMEYFAVWQ